MTDKKIQVEIVQAETNALVGHENVMGVPIPRGAVQFYQVEHPLIFGVDTSVLEK